MSAIYWLVGTWAMVLGVVAWLAYISGPEVTSESEPEDTDAVFAEIWLRQGLRDLAADLQRDVPRGGRHVR